MPMPRISPSALADLDAIWDYIVAEGGHSLAADRQIHAITERFYLLACHPHLGRRRDDDLGAGRRTYPVKGHIIVYRVLDDRVLILRVIHSSRELPLLMR